MYYYLLVCRSLTYAQRSQRVLERAGIRAIITRITRDAVRDGCGYSLKIRADELDNAIGALRKAGVPPRNVLGVTFGGENVEVSV